MALMDQIRQSKEQSFLGLDVPHLLETWATKTPDKAFMIWEPFTGETQFWTYADLASRARCFAQGLSGRGVKSGDFVILHLDNSPEFVVSWFVNRRRP